MLRAYALSVLSMMLTFGVSLTNGAETGQVRPSPGVLQLRRSSWELASQSRQVREEAANISDRLLAKAAERRRSSRPTAHNENFIVWASDGSAGQVLAAAEEYRLEIAVAWLGQELPAGLEPTVIHVQLTDETDVGLAMLNQASTERCHRIWLQTSSERSVGTTLAHEIAHVVLSTRFPTDMPVWATEGVSCRYDDESRCQRRELLLRQFVRTGHWPSLVRLLTADVIAPTDEASYAAAVSLTDYLVTLDDRPTFLRFVADGQETGWETALRRHYEFASLQDLEARWRAWVTATVSSPLPETPAKSHPGWQPVTDLAATNESTVRR